MNATLTEFANASQGFSLISNRKLLALYQSMLSCRKSAESVGLANKHAVGEPVLGFEAALVGSVIDLRAEDVVAPALWPGDVLRHVNTAVGMEPDLDQAIRQAAAAPNSGAVVAFSAGHKRSRARWQKHLQKAAEKKLPILFVSFKGPDPDQTSTIASGASSPALPAILVDRNDVVAVYRVASESMVHARKGHGPTLIECGAAVSGDALENMRDYLVRKGVAKSELDGASDYF